MADLLDYFERNIPKLHISPRLEIFQLLLIIILLF